MVVEKAQAPYGAFYLAEIEWNIGREEDGDREMGLWPIFYFPMTKEDLIGLLEPTVNALGYELIDLDFTPGGGGLVRLFIDKDPVVTLDDCEYVSRQVGDLLDVEDPLPGGYVLEVSSPGLDRRLRTPEHFQDVIGAEIRVELKRAIEGRRRFRGYLTAADATEIVMKVDGTNWQLPLAEVSVARLVPTD